MYFCLNIPVDSDYNGSILNDILDGSAGLMHSDYYGDVGATINLDGSYETNGEITSESCNECEDGDALYYAFDLEEARRRFWERYNRGNEDYIMCETCHDSTYWADLDAYNDHRLEEHDLGDNEVAPEELVAPEPPAAAPTSPATTSDYIALRGPNETTYAGITVSRPTFTGHDELYIINQIPEAVRQFVTMDPVVPAALREAFRIGSFVPRPALFLIDHGPHPRSYVIQPEEMRNLLASYPVPRWTYYIFPPVSQGMNVHAAWGRQIPAPAVDEAAAVV